MNQNRKIPVPGEFYRHFKNKLYQIVAVATHSETGEDMVVYQALYGDFKVWVRPLAMFLEEVDHEKYPNAGQKYRFEQVKLVKAMGPVKHEEKTAEEAKSPKTPPEPKVNEELLSFFDAMDENDYDRMMESLTRLSSCATQKELDDIFLVLDVRPPEGMEEIGEQILFLKRHLATIRRFDGERLR